MGKCDSGDDCEGYLFACAEREWWGVPTVIEFGLFSVGLVIIKLFGRRISSTRAFQKVFLPHHDSLPASLSTET